MKKFSRRISIAATVCVLVLGSAQAAFAATVYYNFDSNVPNVGWRYSSTKTVPAGVNFDTRFDYCRATNGSSEGAKGCLFKPVNASNLTQLAPYKTLKPGSARTTLLSQSSSRRDIKIGLQAVGTSWVTARGYWYY